MYKNEDDDDNDVFDYDDDDVLFIKNYVKLLITDYVR